MIRVHTGRGWRFNPRLLADLKSGLGRGARQPPIMDVLGVEIDGVDLFTGMAEDRIVEVTADLASAVSRLASGYRRAQVACSGGEVELLLERRRDSVALSMVRLRRPAAVRVRDLELELAGLSEAVLRSGRALIEDLRRINPRLVEASPAARLTRALTGALGKPAVDLPEPPPAEGPSRPLIAQSHHAAAAGFRLEVDDSESLLESFAGGRADLRSLLTPGRVALEPGGALPTWSAQGFPFLMLKDLVHSGLEAVRAIEQGDPEHELPLDGTVALHFRLREGQAPAAAFVRETHRGKQQGTHGFQPCEASAFLSSLFDAAVAFGTLAARQNARQAQNQPLAMLLTEAREGLARCRELAALPSPPAALPPPRRRPQEDPQLGPGRLKLLSYRQGWTTRLGAPARRLTALPHAVLVETEASLLQLTAATGKVRWELAAEEGVGLRAAPLPHGGTLVVRGEELLRLQPSGELAWQAPLPGTARSLALAVEGQLEVAAVSVEAEALVLAAARGTALWRFAPPGATGVRVHAVRGRILISTHDGRLYCVSPALGRLLWRTRGRPLDGLPTFGDWLLLAGRTPTELCGVSLRTGKLQRFLEVELERCGGAVRLGRGAVIAGLRDHLGAVAAIDSRGHPLWSWAADERLGPGLPLLLGLPDGLLVRSGRSLSRLGADGRLRWSHPLSEQSHDGLAPKQRRGVAFAGGDAGLFAFDLETGGVLGQLDDQPGTTSLAIDSRLNVYLTGEDGPVRALHVQRFLSVV